VQSEKRKTKTQNSKLLTLSFNFTLLALSFTLAGCQRHHLYKDTQVIMGTFVEVISPDKNAAEIVFGAIKRIDALLSKYKDDSEVSRLNKQGHLKTSLETFFIIKQSKEFYQASDCAFDITVGPLIDLWGFTDKKYNLPKKEEIKKALNSVGSDKIILNSSNNMIEFKLPGMKIDLGGIAKGFALDYAAIKLKKSGIKSCLINAGGQVYALGAKFGKPWRVGILNPRSKAGVKKILELKDQSVSTSGDYEQYFIKDNKRYCHILNPKTGYSADSGVLSVTVIAPSGLVADALSTAIFVLGREKGLALAKKFSGVKVWIIDSGHRDTMPQRQQ